MTGGMLSTPPGAPDAAGAALPLAWARVTLTVIAIVAVLLFLVKIRSILLWVLIGIILAIALQPAVGWLVRHRWNRIIAALVVSFATIAVLLGAVVAIAFPVVTQSDRLIVDLPHLVDSLFRTGGALHILEVKLHVIERLASISPSQVAKVVLGNQQWPIVRLYLDRIAAAVNACAPGSYAEVEIPFR